MSEIIPNAITFAELDRKHGISEPRGPGGDEFPLPAWYRTVREVPLKVMSVEDLSRAIRQGLHLTYVVPEALQRLGSDPLAGSLYDGELLMALKSVPESYWPNHESETLALKSVITAALTNTEITEDVRFDAEELNRRVALVL